MSFEAAVAYLSESSASSKIPENVKLELYALFKCITVSRTPLYPRPSLFDFTGRAKWDAWDNLGKENSNADVEMWKERYIGLARSLGWELQPAVTDDDHPDVQSKPSGRETGMGVSVSVVSRPPPDEPDNSGGTTLHACALSNDATQLRSFLASRPDVDINALDDYGYTALHLAADRGNSAIVKMLLERGVDTGVEDPDELTALHLAEICNHNDIAALIREHITP